MPFNRPTLTALKERILADLTSRLELKGGIMRRSAAGVLATVFAGVSHLMHGHLDWISKQLFVTTAEGDYLEFQHAGVHGITRKASAAAVGSVTFTGLPGSIVVAGTELKRVSDGAVFITMADGLANVPVSAAMAGDSGNCDAGAVLSLLSPISGVNDSATVDVGGISGGTDVESDESLRLRVLQAIQNPAMGGANHDYIRWALEVAGVTRVWCFENWQGVGTVGVTFVRDNDASFIPDENEIMTVQKYLDTKRPVTAEVVVFAPATLAIDVAVVLSPNTEAVRGAVREELQAFFLREGTPGATIYRSRLSEAISSALDEAHHTLTAPTTDVACANYVIASLGTVTFNGA